MHKIKKAVITAAGYGTRFLPITKVIPKEMLPIGNKPVIHYVVDELIDYGIEQILIITSRNKNSIIDYFDHSYEIEDLVKDKQIYHTLIDVASRKNIHFIRQKEIRGHGHSILHARDFIGTDPFFVSLGDVFVPDGKVLLNKLQSSYNTSSQNIIGLSRVEKTRISSVGIADFYKSSPFEIKRILEKPTLDKAPSNIGVIGRYLLTSDIFKSLEIHLSKIGSHEELDLAPALNDLCEGRLVKGVLFEEPYFDVGSPKRLMNANNYINKDKD